MAAVILTIEEDTSMRKHIPEEHERILDVLSALKGYLTEGGTTNEQDELLRSIGCMPPR